MWQILDVPDVPQRLLAFLDVPRFMVSDPVPLETEPWARVVLSFLKITRHDLSW